MKRKIWAVMMIGAALISLVACGGNTDTQDTATGAQEQEVVNIDIGNEDQQSDQINTDDTAVTEDTDNADEAAQMDETAPADSTVADENGQTANFEGQWYEEIAGRGVIEIESTGDDTYSILVHWGSSAFESANWTMVGTYDPSTGKLEYTDAKYYIITFEDEENYTEDVRYEDGTGEFWITEDGKLGWISDRSEDDGITGDSVFVNSGL